MDISREELAALKEISAERHFDSNFEFLLQHNGWRRGAIHVMLGVSHGGKSTLVRTLLIDLIEKTNSKQKIGLWLSEESVEDFLLEMSHSGFYDLEKLKIVSEQNEVFKNAKSAFLKLSELCDECDIVLLDNITTSVLYMDRTPSQQSLMANHLKRMAKDKNIPLIIAAHTKKNVGTNYDGMIEMEDVRGSGTLPNVAQFFYVLQSIYIGGERYNTLRTTKHRGQNVKIKLFQLFYYPSRRIFGKDEEINFAKFKELFKQRNRL